MNVFFITWTLLTPHMCASQSFPAVKQWKAQSLVVSSGILVNGEIIGDKQIPPDGKINTYFWRFGIIHQKLGVRLEVSTQDITAFQDGKRVKLLWSDTASLKGAKWVAKTTRLSSPSGKDPNTWEIWQYDVPIHPLHLPLLYPSVWIFTWPRIVV